MPIPFRCPHCGLQTQVDPQYAGQSGPCAGCGQMIAIPSSAGGAGPSAAPAAPPQTKSNFLVPAAVLVALAFGGLAIVGILVALLLPAVSAAREAARRAACLNQMKQIAFAMIEYEAKNGSYPPAYTVDDSGRPMHSWRVLLLPYLGPEAQSIYNQYDLSAPWDSPQNQGLAGAMPSVFRCPSDPAPPGDTSYCVVTGPGMMFQADKTTKIADLQARGGPTQVLLLVEAQGSGINWLEPGDVTEPQLVQGIDSGLPGGCASHHVGGMCVAYADGQVAFLSDTTHPEDLRDMAKINPAATAE